MMEITVLRPWAFVFVLPAVLFCFFKLKAVRAWLGVVDAHLLEPLIVKTYVRLKERFMAAFLILCVCFLLFALAGVSLKSGKDFLYYPKSPAVIVLDMSLSMKVKDVSPNRFSRAIFKVYDLLEELKGIPTALIVFTDEPYRLIPVTTDKKVIETVLPLLNFSLMPSQDSRTDRALREALNTIKEAGAAFGDIFLITDGGDDVLEIQDKTQELIRSAALNKNRLFILGVGTPQGGTLFEKEDVPVLNILGNPVKHRLKEGHLKHWAELGGGKYVRIQTDNTDVTALAKARAGLLTGEKSDLTDPSLGDTGYWFLILPLIGFSFLFQKGRLLIGLLAVLTSFPAHAEISDYFLSPSGVAMRHLELGRQEAAIAVADGSNDFTALYNVGTKLILLQNYPQAVVLLEKAVQLRPDDENAQVNLEIARRLNENPPENETSDAGENDQSQNPDQSDNRQGGSEGENNLNQNSNSSPQDVDSKENKDENFGEKAGDSDAGQNGRGAGGGPNENGENPDADAGGNKGDFSSGSEGKGGSGQEENEDEDRSSDQPDNENKMLPVHEDPLTLLRHKILFLHRENRYNQEERIGTQW